jgi:hypothetical protein
MWEKEKVIDEYTIWKKLDIEGKPFFNITKGEEPNIEAGGYYNLESLLKLKGLKVRQ